MKFLGLYVPDYWESVTPEQRMECYNGCGAEWFPDWLRSLFNLLYWWGLDAVQIHDVEYSFSTSKLGADFRLLKNLLTRADYDNIRILQSVLAYIGVALFGRKAWKKGHEKDKEKDERAV